MRLLVALGLAAGLYGLAGAQDKKPDDKKPLGERIAEITKELQDAQGPLIKEFQAAKSDKEKEAVREKAMAMMPKAAEKIVAAVSESPKDPAAFAALMQAMQMAQGGPAADKAADLIATHHADNPMLKGALPGLGASGEAGQKVLKTLYAKATDKATKGSTLYYLASGMLESADYPRGGPPLPADKQAAAFKEAETLLKQAAKEYGDVEVPGRGEATTVAKAAEKQLFFLNNLTVGKVLPDAEVQDLNGKKVKISDYRGKVVALDIWATWCGPCVAMIPHSRELVKKLDGKPFALISLSADAKKETLTKFMEETPMPWTQWWNGGAQGGAIEAYNVRFYPTIYILDDKGVIRFKHKRGAEMDKAVEELLKEVKTKG